MSAILGLETDICGLLPDGKSSPNVCAVPGNDVSRKTLVRPPGYRYGNLHGMDFAVHGYSSFGFMGTPAHHSQNGSDLVYHGDSSPTCTLPVISHLNPTPRLLALAQEVDAVTPKQIVIADAAGLSKNSRQIMEGLNFTSWRELPKTIAIIIDSNICDEGILGHELMHIWLDLVEGYEDHRCYHDLGNGKNYFEVISVQSFVIDCKVQQRLNERGFSLRNFTEDVVDPLYENAVALEAGVHLRNRSQESIVARLLSLPLAVPELYEFTIEDWGKIRYAQSIFEHYLPEMIRLAERIAETFREYDYKTTAGMRRLIDELLLLHFQFIEENFDLTHDMITTEDHVVYRNKHPHILPNVPPREKYNILRKLIREKWPAGTRVVAKWLDNNCLHTEFILPSNKAKHGKARPADGRSDNSATISFKYDGTSQEGR